MATNSPNSTITVAVETEGLTIAVLKAKALTSLSSRKFLLAVGMFLGSMAVAVFKPELIGDGNVQALFNFWVMLAGVFAGGNIGEHLVKAKS